MPNLKTASVYVSFVLEKNKYIMDVRPRHPSIVNIATPQINIYFLYPYCVLI